MVVVPLQQTQLHTLLLHELLLLQQRSLLHLKLPLCQCWHLRLQFAAAASAGPSMCAGLRLLEPAAWQLHSPKQPRHGLQVQARRWCACTAPAGGGSCIRWE